METFDDVDENDSGITVGCDDDGNGCVPGLSNVRVNVGTAVESLSISDDDDDDDEEEEEEEEDTIFGIEISTSGLDLVLDLTTADGGPLPIELVAYT